MFAGSRLLLPITSYLLTVIKVRIMGLKCILICIFIFTCKANCLLKQNVNNNTEVRVRGLSMSCLCPVFILLPEYSLISSLISHSVQLVIISPLCLPLVFMDISPTGMTHKLPRPIAVHFLPDQSEHGNEGMPAVGAWGNLVCGVGTVKQ